jgi:hypothetical protein
MRHVAIPIPTAIGLILLCTPALAQDKDGEVAFNNACRTLPHPP